MTCTYCGRRFATTDQWIDHFVQEHTTHMPPTVAGGRASYMDVTLDYNSAQHLHDWLDAQAVGLSEQVVELAKAREAPDFPAIRIYMRVEPLYDNEKGTQGV